MKTVAVEPELCAYCGEPMPTNVERYRYCSDLCGLLARDRLNKMCQRERWDELMPPEPAEILLRNPHSLDGLGMKAGECLYITRDDYDAMDDVRSKVWKFYVRLV